MIWYRWGKTQGSESLLVEYEASVGRQRVTQLLWGKGWYWKSEERILDKWR